VIHQGIKPTQEHKLHFTVQYYTYILHRENQRQVTMTLFGVKSA